MQHRTGSALILVLLLTLVLAAFGIVAMRDVAAGTRQSASFRTRTQAMLLSSSAANAISMRASQKPDVYLGSNGSSSSTDIVNVVRGRRVVFNHVDLGPSANPTGILPLQDGTDSGLFKLDADVNAKTFESQQETSWDIVLHSMVDFRAVENSEQRCTKRVTVSSRAQVGEPDPTWTDMTRRIGRSRHSQDVMIGPVSCSN